MSTHNDKDSMIHNVRENVFKPSVNISIEGRNVVKGYDFDKGRDFDALLESYLNQGFQSTAFGEAIEEIKRMISWRLSDTPWTDAEADVYQDPEVRKNIRCTIYLGYTSNMISCGVREIIKYLCKHKMVDVIVTTCGGIEEDFIKCFADTYIGDFSLDGRSLRLQALNRIGNLIIPNNNYVGFEDWLSPILEDIYKHQVETGEVMTPSSLIHRLGKEINNEDSVYYWCYKNNIPVFCPAITDGSIGDILAMMAFQYPDFKCDVISDIKKIHSISLNAKRTGQIILGGGLVKHHILNTNLMRNGADYSVFINTAQEFDGSDAGARPDEAKSWGKIKIDSNPVKVFGEASIIFPLMVAMTFAKPGIWEEKIDFEIKY